ncbi:poly-gamma-glutamate biosynthesis protein PgsC [Oceanobacillus profundus]|uniref:Poly-gamma-glutamate biosynthesis protein PgsC n=1 Tax=Oceanobacillus profundus TaxID=372463 RepID=A0A417YD19_9BACI|nr:poly-gamma-glutamate biosynthesis protein PgsC [Oceanobacillus profundus]MBR3120563.1 poly-gamma-glutamate biosynthesis protein PgsC [Oceanobacillus sp.]PAE27067.1 poly-gamma-glutamate biosynthesis protein PgsC [Paenibacillus sp. 7884-2]MCM3397705.1 poly-gamma-glutamate biosynthesis protein PgsC [Oceanobacillus profundus]MDO6451450.1 poly-gamma-glutamate biosynthesis protein PgsC [Oceanobacillus profundus]RHW30521.1 poly-gamma-glutamate biosynthesis protein PgsC [Oceanobacillus profundus]
MFVFDTGDIYLAITAGVILSLFYTEFTGVIPAGLVVPGYIAMMFTTPASIVVTFLVSFLTYLIVMKVISKFTILYGRRKFTAMITTGIIMKAIFDFAFAEYSIPEAVGGLVAIGIIVPGLIANTIQKQGVLPTVASTLLLSGLTFGTVFVSNYI